MALSSAAVARYLQLFASDPYRDLAWADDLQESMRDLGLIDAGRLAAPVLRPHFLPKSQFATLVRLMERFSAIAEHVYSLTLQSGPLLSRLRLLPVERALADLSPGCSRLSISAHAEAHVQGSNWRLSGFQSATASRLAFMDPLTEAFLKLPILRDLQLSGFPVRAACCGGRLYQAVLKTWKDFGGKNIPGIAVLHDAGTAPHEGQLLAESLSRGGADARVVCAESLEYADGRLKSRDFVVDVVFRSMTARQLLLRIDLSHSLFNACRHGAVCVINSFRSEIVNRRLFFELLTDLHVTRSLAAGDVKLIRDLVPWTRRLAPGETEFHGTAVDLLEFVRKNRQHLALLPNEESAGLPSFCGAEMTSLAWERALANSLRSVYVVQENAVCDTESFPVYQYGNLQMQSADVTVRPHIFNGKVHSASAVLACRRLGSSIPLALAPILLLDTI